MLVTYDPAVQGAEFSEKESKTLARLKDKPEFTSFSADEPELTDSLIQRMRRAAREKKSQGKILALRNKP